MHKHGSYSHLLSKKMRRTILRSPLQFLTMVLILGLASTLLSGLYASHLAFQDQIDNLYEASNIADITSTLTYNYNDKDFDPSAANEDYQLIKNTVGDAGKVETQYNSAAHIQGLVSSICIADKFPTINIPFELYGKAENDFYLIFSKAYLYNALLYGEQSTWIDENGNYKEIEIELNIASLKNRIENNTTLKNLLAHYTREGKKNLFDNDYFAMDVVPTGHMQYAENIASNVTQPFTFIASRSFIKYYLEKALTMTYDIEQLDKDIESASGTELENLLECKSLLDFENGKNEIADNYWCNNRCVTRLNNRDDATTYRDKIDSAFKKKGEDNNLLLNIQLADSTANQQLSTDLTQSVQLCYVFPPIFFLVSVLIVLTTISQIILKERKEIGELKALGASNRSIFTYYIVLTDIVALIGVALGLVVGPLLLPIILDIKYQMLYSIPSIRYVFPTFIAVGMTIIVLLVSTLVAYLIARKEIKALPVTSMRPKVTNIKHKNISESKQDNTHKLCFKMAMRNIFCSIPRSIMVVVGVLGCTALLCCGFGIDDSIQCGINNDINVFFNTDSLISFSNPTAETIKTIEELKTEDGTSMITAFEPFGYLPSNTSKVGIINKSFTTNVYSIPYIYEQQYKFFDIGYLPKENHIAISNKVAKNLGVGVGDLLNYEFLGKTYTGTISKVVDTFYIHGVFIDGLYPQNPYLPTSAYARFNKDLDQKTIINAISKVPGVSNVVNKASLTELVTNIASSLSYITTTVKVFAVLLAVVAIYNLALLNFKENTRNIATMKVLGFNRREVAESLFFEIITLSAVGALIGLTLGYPLTRLTLGINQVPMCEFFYYLGPVSVILSLLISLGVSAIINSFVGMRNKRVKMVESLKSVE